MISLNKRFVLSMIVPIIFDNFLAVYQRYVNGRPVRVMGPDLASYVAGFVFMLAVANYLFIDCRQPIYLQYVSCSSLSATQNVF